MEFKSGSTAKKNDPEKFVFTVTKEIGEVPNTDLRIDFGHYGNNDDKFYLRRKPRNGEWRYAKAFSFSGDELNALRDFLNS